MCDQQSLISACAYAQYDQNLRLSLEYSMSVKLLNEHHLEFLSLKGGYTGSSESTLVKMPQWWKSHVTAYIMSEIWVMPGNLQTHGRIQRGTGGPDPLIHVNITSGYACRFPLNFWYGPSTPLEMELDPRDPVASLWNTVMNKMSFQDPRAEFSGPHNSVEISRLFSQCNASFIT